MSAHDEYGQWDAAYVLGALSPEQRQQFETHLAGCPACTDAVDELSAVRGALGALPAADADSMLAEPVPTDILAGLAARVRRRRRVRGWTTGIAGVAAAAAIVMALVLPVALNAPAPPTVTASLQPVVDNPIAARIQLTEAAWGTKIALTCSYAASTGLSPERYPSSGAYALYFVDRAGAATRVSSWRAGPGETVHAAGSIDESVSAIARVELRSLTTGGVLLSHNFAASSTN